MRIIVLHENHPHLGGGKELMKGASMKILFAHCSTDHCLVLSANRLCPPAFPNFFLQSINNAEDSRVQASPGYIPNNRRTLSEAAGSLDSAMLHCLFTPQNQTMLCLQDLPKLEARAYNLRKDTNLQEIHL